MSDAETIFDDAKRRPSRFGPFIFALTLLAGTLLYLLTHEMILAIVMPCLHGGWNHFRTGFWLLNTDPRHCRARICFIFYLAAACWNAAAAAVAFIFLAIVSGIEPNMKDVEANLYVLVWGILFNTILGLVAISAALAFKIRVWVHPRLRNQVQGDLRLAANLKPLRYGFNYAIFVVATAVVSLSLVLSVLCLAAMMIDNMAKLLQNISPILITFVAVFGPPFAAIPFYGWISSRIIAVNPQECWPEETVTDEFTAFRQGIDV